MEDFETLGRIGEGAHGIVFKAKHLQVSVWAINGTDHGPLVLSCIFDFKNGRIVALKKVSLKRLDDGIPNRVLREIKALQELKHVNVSLKDPK